MTKLIVLPVHRLLVRDLFYRAFASRGIRLKFKRAVHDRLARKLAAGYVIGAKLLSHTKGAAKSEEDTVRFYLFSFNKGEGKAELFKGVSTGTKVIRSK
jgi:hypothetical protein